MKINRLWIVNAAFFMGLFWAIPSKAQHDCSWNGGFAGFWTTTIKQFDATATGNWDCPENIIFPLETNFPHNSTPAGPYFNAEIADGSTVTVQPILPIYVSNLTLLDNSWVLLNDNSHLSIQNTGGAGVVTSDGSIIMNNATGALSTYLTADGQATFTGGGTVVLNGSGNVVGGNNAFNFNSTLIIDDHLFSGAGAIGAETTSIRLLPAGILRADRPLDFLEIDPGTNNSVENMGRLESTDGSVLRIKQTTVDNEGGVIFADTGSAVEIQDSTVFSGSFTGGGIIFSLGLVNLESPVGMQMSNATTLSIVNGGVTILDGSLDNQSLINIGGGSFLLKTPAALEGGGTVTLAVPLEGGTSTLGAVSGSGATLVNTDNLIQGGGNILVPLTNEFTVRADEPTAPLRIQSPFTNNSALEVVSGAQLNIRSSVDGLGGGSIDASAGTVRVDSGGSISAGTVSIQLGSTLELANGSVSDASVNNSPGGTIRVSQFITNRLSGLINNPAGAEIIVQDNCGVVLDDFGTYQISGTIKLEGVGTYTSFSNSSLRLDGIVTLDGGGVIEMSNSSKNIIISSGGASGTLVNNNLTIRGSGRIGGGIGIVNSGLIHANLPPTADAGSGTISIDPDASAMLNTGTLRASNGGTLLLRDGVYTNMGAMIEATAGGSIALDASAEIHGGTLATSGGGQALVRREATFDGTTSAMEVDAQTTIENLGRLRLIGNITNRQILRVVDSGQIQIDGPVTLSGGGELNLSSTGSRLVALPGSIPDDRLVNLDNRITGNGSVLFLSIENSGTLAPGNSPGKIFTGNLTQTASATLEIEIQGITTGAFDTVQVQGTAQLGGTLNVIPLPGLNVSAGSTFDILTASVISGSFDQVNIPVDGNSQPLFTLAQIGTTILRLTAVSDILIPLTYDDWASQQGLDPSNNDPGADPNHDGIVNLAAYTLGIPALGVRLPDSGISAKAAPGGGVILGFNSPVTVTGIEITSQLSTTLANGTWELGPIPAIITTIDGIHHYEVTIPSGSDENFGRLVFEQQ